jgi:hypothetical protein
MKAPRTEVFPSIAAAQTYIYDCARRQAICNLGTPKLTLTIGRVNGGRKPARSIPIKSPDWICLWKANNAFATT